MMAALWRGTLAALLTKNIYQKTQLTSVRLHSSKNEISKNEIERAFGILASRNRSWKRLRHVIDLVKDDSTSIVDVGTDHGLLAVALALTGSWSVIGVDSSTKALEGALGLEKEVTKYRQNLPLEFRVGDGLHGLEKGQADTVCIAGMGVHSMVKILEGKRDEGYSSFLLDELNTKHLILQPTNSKPKNLLGLYQTLQGHGWILVDERIEWLSSRWYVSASWERGTKAQQLPGSFLRKHSGSQKLIFDEYIRHHVVWLQKDLMLAGDLTDLEHRWLKEVNADAPM